MRSLKLRQGLTLTALGLILAFGLLVGCGSSSDPTPPADGDSEAENDSDADTTVKTATKFMVGYGEADLTPPVGTVMGAYGTPGGGRKTEGVHDNLRGQVLLFVNDAGQAYMMITADMAGWFYEYGAWSAPNGAGEAPGVREIRKNIVEALKDKLELTPESIVITSSHSHAAPDLIGFFQKTNTGPDRALLRSYRDKLVQAAKDAQANLQDATLYFGKSELVGLSGGGLGGKSNPWKDSEIDNSLNIMQAKDKDGKIIFTSVNYANHPTSMNMDNRQASADWVWGYREEFEKNVGGKAVFMQGPEAAVHDGPKFRDIQAQYGEVSWDTTYQIGKVVADAVQAALPNLVQAKEFDILHRAAKTSCLATGGFMMMGIQYFKVPKRTLTPVYADDDPTHAKDPVGYTVMELEVSWHKLGDAEFAIFPGEATPTLGTLVKGHMVSAHKFAIALGNDSLGYIVEAEAVANDASENKELKNYELTMGLGEPGAPCVMKAVESLNWYDGAYKTAP